MDNTLTKLLDQQFAYQRKNAERFDSQGKRRYTYIELLDYWFNGMISKEELQNMKKDCLQVVKMEDVNIRYVVYATVDGKATRRFVCEDQEDLIRTVKVELEEEIEEEKLYQELNNTEEDYGQE